MYKCYDTCSLLNEAGHLFESDDVTLVISSITLEELEHIKTSANKDASIKYSARKVLLDLDAHYGSYEIVLYNDDMGIDMLADNISLSNDAKIIACARFFKEQHPEEDLIFVSDDLICRHIARMYFKTEKTVENKYDYDGYREVYLTDEELVEFYSNPTYNMFNLFVNEYLLVYNEDGDCIDCVCWTGEEYRHLTYGNFNSKWFGDVKPVKGDLYQPLVIDSLLNNKITMIKGPAGSGKTFLSLGYLIYKLERH
jgi:predicted ribonuclease YlaK